MLGGGDLALLEDGRPRRRQRPRRRRRVRHRRRPRRAPRRGRRRRRRLLLDRRRHAAEDRQAGPPPAPGARPPPRRGGDGQTSAGRRARWPPPPRASAPAAASGASGLSGVAAAAHGSSPLVRERRDGAEDGPAQERVHRRALGGVLGEEGVEERAEARRVAAAHAGRVDPPARDLAHQAVHPAARRLRVELGDPRRAHRHQLVEHAAERPHVGGARVRLALAHLGRHVQRRAALGHRLRLREGEELRDAKVAELDLAVVEEDVRRLEVAVEELVRVVAARERRRRLVEDRQHLGLREVGAHALLRRDARREVAVVRVLHQDAQVVAVAVRVDVRDDVRVLQPLEHLDLLHRRLLLVARHVRHRDLFADELLADGVVADEPHGAERAAADDADLLVVVLGELRVLGVQHGCAS